MRWSHDSGDTVEPERDVVVSKTRASIPTIGSAFHEPGGSLRLEGQVIDEQDKPVAGVDISISRDPRHVISESDGSFAYDGLASCSHVVSA